MGFFQDLASSTKKILAPVNNIGKGIASGFKSVTHGIGAGIKSLGSGIGTIFKDGESLISGIVKAGENFLNRGMNLLSSPMFLIVLAIGGVVALSVLSR